MGYSAKAVANHFLRNYRDRGITPLKIQKLVYLSHGWNYPLNGNDLIDDELAEAWLYGPVFPSLYQEFSHRGDLPITDLATDLRPESPDSRSLVRFWPEIPDSDDRVRHLLSEIWRIYGGYTGSQLSDMCHQPGSPWDQTKRNHQPPIRNAHIPNDVIREYYVNLYHQNKQ